MVVTLHPIQSPALFPSASGCRHKMAAIIHIASSVKCIYIVQVEIQVYKFTFNVEYSQPKYSLNSNRYVYTFTVHGYIF